MSDRPLWPASRLHSRALQAERCPQDEAFSETDNLTRCPRPSDPDGEGRLSGGVWAETGHRPRWKTLRLNWLHSGERARVAPGPLGRANKSRSRYRRKAACHSKEVLLPPIFADADIVHMHRHHRLPTHTFELRVVWSAWRRNCLGSAAWSASCLRGLGSHRCSRKCCASMRGVESFRSRVFARRTVDSTAFDSSSNCLCLRRFEALSCCLKVLC